VLNSDLHSILGTHVHPTDAQKPEGTLGHVGNHSTCSYPQCCWCPTPTTSCLLIGPCPTRVPLSRGQLCPAWCLASLALHTQVFISRSPAATAHTGYSHHFPSDQGRWPKSPLLLGTS
jgi:hypothetical protein